jgi:hypothetical protein
LGVVNPEGSVSVNPTPVRATVALGLVMVKVRVEVPPFGRTRFGLKDLAIIGGATTVIDAEAVFPVPPFVALTLPDTLFFTPAVAPVTVTVIMQLLLDASVPPLKLIVPGAVVVSVPPHCDELPVVTVSPPGSVSVNPIPFSVVVVFGLVIVNVSVAVPPIGIVVASKLFEIDGGPTTVNVAVFEVVPAPLSFELIAPVVFIHTPVVEPVTVTLKLQLVPPVNIPPVKVILFDAALVVSVPPQVVVLESPTVTPDGSVSVKLIPLRFCDPFGLVIVKLRLVVAPSSTLEEPNALLIVGGAATLNIAVFEVVPVPPLVDETWPVVLLY